MGTEHPMIMRAVEDFLKWPRVSYYLEQLVAATRSLDCSRARELLMESVAGYTPGNGVDDLVWKNSDAPVRSTPAAVANLSRRRPAQATTIN
jgi:hypothetical protein